MNVKKISDLTSTSSIGDNDDFVLNQNDLTKKIAFSVIKSSIGTPQNVELTTNKVTSLSSASTDTQYPSAKCVYDIVGDIATALDTINGEVV